MGSKNKITHKSFCADPTMTITLTLQFLCIKPLTNISFCHNYVYSTSEKYDEDWKTPGGTSERWTSDEGGEEEEVRVS